MHLPGSTIKEIATNPEEAGKFVFEIIPGRPQQVGQRCNAEVKFPFYFWILEVKAIFGDSFN